MEEILHRAVYITAALLGGAFRGFIAGLFPAAVAFKRGSVKYAKASLAISLGIGLLFPASVSVLASIVLLIVILRKVPAAHAAPKLKIPGARDQTD